MILERMKYLTIGLFIGYLFYGNIQLKKELKKFKKDTDEIVSIAFNRIGQNSNDATQNRNISRMNYRVGEELKNRLAELHKAGTIKITIKEEGEE